MKLRFKYTGFIKRKCLNYNHFIYYSRDHFKRIKYSIIEQNLHLFKNIEWNGIGFYSTRI